MQSDFSINCYDIEASYSATSFSIFDKKFTSEAVANIAFKLRDKDGIIKYLDNYLEKMKNLCRDLQLENHRLQLGTFDMNQLIQNPKLNTIASKIFGKLSLRVLRKCKLVCKTWNKQINNTKLYWRKELQTLLNQPSMKVFIEESNKNWQNVFQSVKTKDNARDTKVFYLWIKKFWLANNRQVKHHKPKRNREHFKFKYNPIMDYIQEDSHSLPFLKVLIRNKFNFSSIDGNKFINRACKKGQIKIVKTLLPLLKTGTVLGVNQEYYSKNWCEMYAYCECEDDGYDTPKYDFLAYACMNGHLNVAKLLIQNATKIGINLSKKYDDSHYFADSGQDFIDPEDHGTLLHIATYKCNIEVVKLLLEAGKNGYNIDVNAARTRTAVYKHRHKDHDKEETAFWIACKSRKVEMVKLFLDYSEVLEIDMDITKYDKNVSEDIRELLDSHIKIKTEPGLTVNVDENLTMTFEDVKPIVKLERFDDVETNVSSRKRKRNE